MSYLTQDLLMWLALFLAVSLLLIYCVCRWERTPEYARRLAKAMRQAAHHKRVGRPDFSFFINPWSR